ncbi:LTA synthase family protein [Geobacter sulfurreducens]|uniref:Sulfatase n=1 Tax=Geobacter sulfurreducens (strain ATCC 51573 / DSM 12127 / PCA) TaxID=243231 RepID=Q748Q3_GEOSL|nr:LTA synthase family protein [Geobacter sulfurreducens]AAR36340.1 sulfatase [Geobacter sulfurreducens PCA]ADI85704.1 sulfatase [Geobacter sulfurreducens KN400]UAC03627.1 LTA synthase family protein [Geobacter sulfurreducens]UTG92266.1 sulfatase-like hydrolase/transferase [Geobacter sulfurreducens]HBB70364.1 sulfatase [Geobacter sulfurreducens]
MNLRRNLGIITLFSLIYLAIATVTRTVLLTMVPKGSGLTLPLVAKAYAAGLLFDVAALAYLLIPAALYLILAPRRLVEHRKHAWLVQAAFLVIIAALIFGAVAEYFFFEEFATRFNFIAVDYLIYTGEVIGNIRESYPLVPILGAILAAALILTRLLQGAIDRAAAITFSGRRRRLGAALLALPLAALLFVNISTTAISANSYANELAGNGLYGLFAAFRNNELDFTRFYATRDNQQVMARLRDMVEERNNHFVAPPPRMTRQITGEGREKRLNVIVVVEESLSAEFLGAWGDTRGLSPNIDRLARESLVFSHLYASGTRTIRGLEALSLSIPPLPGTSIVKRPDNGGFRSWGEVMKEKGYDTRYIYAGYGYFDNMNAFFSANGFDIVDRNSFAQDEITFANIWGVCDEDLFRKTIRESRASFAAGRPFFSMVMTTSNHRPFTYPAGKIDIPSKTGRDGGVKYADYAIGRFLAEARKEPWFKDTVFVFVADHCASSAGKTDLPVKKYEIPLLVYAPHHVKPGRVDRMMAQIDVAPTVLGLLNMSYTTDFLGHDILKAANRPERAFISTYQKLGYIEGDRLLILSPQKGVGVVRFDRRSGATEPLPMDERLLQEALAWYQGANYIYKNRLNRIP